MRPSTVRKPAHPRPAYTLEAHDYSRGPMGYGMGKLEIIDHDGHGGLTFEERPFVIMHDHAFVPLGSYPARPSDTTPSAPASKLPRPCRRCVSRPGSLSCWWLAIVPTPRPDRHAPGSGR